MAKNKSDVFIICGERSGDLHGSFIVKKLLAKTVAVDSAPPALRKGKKKYILFIKIT